MATEFKLPELGENIESADIVSVLVKAGDVIEKEQSIIEIETDKATIEVPSNVSGKITEVLVKLGESVKVGAPYVAGSTVTAEVIGQGRHDKVTIIKFRRRKHYMKRAGHRQWYTEVKITGIKA